MLLNTTADVDDNHDHGNVILEYLYRYAFLSNRTRLLCRALHTGTHIIVCGRVKLR